MSLIERLGFASPVIGSPVTDTDRTVQLPPTWRINTPEDARRELVRAQYAPLSELPMFCKPWAI